MESEGGRPVSEEKKVTLELSVYQAAAVRASLFTDTKGYTYDPKYVPPRIVEIRNVINDIDEQIDEFLSEENK